MLTNKLLPIILLLFMALTVGCASTVEVTVNAIAKNTQHSSAKQYVLSSAISDIDETDLFFREYSEYFETILKKQGLTRVDQRQHADLDIRFGYGISDGTAGISSFSVPVYATIGGETVTITERTTDSSGNPATIVRTIYIPPRFRRIGTEIESRSYILFNRTATLEAREITADENKGDPIWMLMISSVGESEDLRGIMPYMAAAAAGFIGKNTGKQQYMEIDINDPLVLELKSNLMKPEAVK